MYVEPQATYVAVTPRWGCFSCSACYVCSWTMPTDLEVLGVMNLWSEFPDL